MDTRIASLLVTIMVVFQLPATAGELLQIPLGNLEMEAVAPMDFEAELRKLNLRGYHLHHQRAERSQIAGTKFEVHDHSRSEDCLGGGAHAEPSPADLHHHPAHPRADGTAPSVTPQEHRTFGTIRDLILRSELSPWVRQRAVAVFGRVAQAEGKIHGLPAEQVHFHEVGALDSIVDIVGACIALELLDKPRVLSGPVVEGTGFLRHMVRILVGSLEGRDVSNLQ